MRTKENKTKFRPIVRTGGGINWNYHDFLVTAISIAKYRSDEINYLNADATWHTLLTIEAYNETPASEHAFLPLVSLGGDENKYIPWGATIPDEEGNYYYTSFSPAGYFVPWLFIKVFRLEICEKSLYIFNSVLFTISAVLWGTFISWIFRSEKDRILLSIIGVLVYVLTPELLHGMGVVYWHQSLMQVTLLAQILSFMRMRAYGSKSSAIIFYTLAILNPYTEWTGYIANVGFALAEIVLGYKDNWKRAFTRAAFLGLLTGCSFGIFTGHYLLRVDAADFFAVLKGRFMARNVSLPINLTLLFGSYLKSFLYSWILLLILIMWNIAKKQSIELKHGVLMIVLAFPILENIIMKQHALEYTYDRMKASFLLSFLICEMIHQLLMNCENKKMTAIVVSGLVIITGVFNLNSYIHDEEYIWSTSYQAENRKIAGYINKNYADSVLGIENLAIRGYMNLLFDRGIYEFTDIEFLRNQAAEKRKRYAVILNVENPGSWSVYDLSGATVYDMQTGKYLKIVTKEDEIKTIALLEDGRLYQLSSLTDGNWTAGYSNTANILLFEYNEKLLTDLLHSTNIVCDGVSFFIEDIDYDTLWIRVAVGTDATICKYPNYIQLVKLE